MTRIKICGLTRPQDAEIAIELGASALGFVFEPTSPRLVEASAGEWIGRLGPYVSRVAVYGVFRSNPCPEAFDAIQAVGWEARPERWQRTIHAIRVRAAGQAIEVEPHAEAIVLDAFREDAFGGTGERIDWGYAAEVVRSQPLPVILAGGLTPENVAEAVRAVRPYAVDVSSGVESAPGIKDHARMREFVARVREAEI